jgi:hypothetical protein
MIERHKIPTDWLQEMEVSVTTTVVQLGSARSMKTRCGLGPWCQWPLRSILWTNKDARHPTNHRCPYRADDHCDAVLVLFFFSSLLPRLDGEYPWASATPTVDDARHPTTP